MQFGERALAMAEGVHGPEHTNVAVAANNFGAILQARGDLPAALTYSRRALAIDEKLYGPEHADASVLRSPFGGVTHRG